MPVFEVVALGIMRSVINCSRERKLDTHLQCEH